MNIYAFKVFVLVSYHNNFSPTTVGCFENDPIFLKNNNLEDISPFCGATDTRVLDF